MSFPVIPTRSEANNNIAIVVNLLIKLLLSESGNAHSPAQDDIYDGKSTSIYMYYLSDIICFARNILVSVTSHNCPSTFTSLLLPKVR